MTSRYDSMNKLTARLAHLAHRVEESKWTYPALVGRRFRTAALMLGLAAGLAAAPGANAQTANKPPPSPTVTLTFKGTYVTGSCSVVGASDIEVELPTVSAAALSANGQSHGETLFNIPIQCDGATTAARVYFDSGAGIDGTTGNLIPIAEAGAASNVQIRLFNGDRSPIRVGDRSTTKVIPITSTDIVHIPFIASYYATGRATAGTVRTYATYVIELP
jgi:major type 1 subunit fimbrin (pilin)